MIVNICGVLLTFALAFLVIRLVFLVLGVVGSLPGIHFLNQMAGSLLGFVQGLAVIWIGCFVLTVFSGTQWGQQVLAAVDGNPFLRSLYDGALSFGSVLQLGRNFL